jgi:hypothetical protein
VLDQKWKQHDDFTHAVYKSPEEYLQGAKDLLNAPDGPDVETAFRQHDNTVIKRRKSTGEFITVHLDEGSDTGRIGSYFRPDNPNQYWNNEINR